MFRYAVDFDIYLYADSDEVAEAKAKLFAFIIDNCGDLKSDDEEVQDLLKELNDNKCEVNQITKIVTEL